MSLSSVKAQDLIIKQTGETIKAYRTDVGDKTVYYQLEDTEDAPVLKIQITDVLVIKMQSGEVIYPRLEKSSQPLNEGQDVVITPPTKPVADPSVIASVQIGSLIEFYDGSKGVVFYLDGNGHGLAVYLKETKHSICWQKASSWRDCIDIEMIPNGRNEELKMGLGATYCDAAIKQLRLEHLPAINWCRSIGADWYLPSLGELYELLDVANLKKGVDGPVSLALKANGGEPLDAFLFYQSCSEDDDTDVFSVLGKGDVRTVKKYSGGNCRAIRMF